MSELFQQSISSIEEFYKDHDYRLGWRFLNCSKSVLANDPKVVFITLNPGGKCIPENHPWASCENGSSYLNEVWGNSPRGKSNLQIQIQLMFSILAKKIDFDGTTEELIEQTLSGYFVPFRSPRLADLDYKNEAFKFGNRLWSRMLYAIKPDYFICIDRDSFSKLQPIIKRTYNLPITSSKKLKTGWGNYSADIVEFGASSEKRLLRLPHLSTFKVFTSQKCAEKIDELFSEFCKKL